MENIADNPQSWKSRPLIFLSLTETAVFVLFKCRNVYFDDKILIITVH